MQYTCVEILVLTSLLRRPHPVKPLTSSQSEKKEGRSVLEKLKSTIHPGRSAHQVAAEPERSQVLRYKNTMQHLNEPFITFHIKYIKNIYICSSTETFTETMLCCLILLMQLKKHFYMNVCDTFNLTVKGHSSAVTCTPGIAHILVRLCLV